MTRTKGILAIAVALALAVAQISIVAAAPQADPLVGTIDSISEGTDAGGNAIIIVNYTDTDGLAQTATLSLADAEALGLITVDPITGVVTIVAGTGTPIDLTGTVEVDPCAPASDPAALTGETAGTTDALAPDGETTDESGQPVATALCGYFNGTLGVTYPMIMAWHEDGLGFGVIAQALFMAELGGLDPQAILDAKKSGDFSTLGLEGVDNWGRLRQSLLGKTVDKATHNLGAIMSGRITPVVTDTPTVEPTTTTTTLLTVGHGKGGQHGKSGEHGKGHNK